MDSANECFSGYTR